MPAERCDPILDRANRSRRDRRLGRRLSLRQERHTDGNEKCSRGVRCGVCLHLCARLCCAQRRYGQRHSEQFFLWAGHWYDRDGRRIRGRRHFWWGVQSGRSGGHRRDEAGKPLADLDPHRRGPGRRRHRRLHL